MRSPLASFVQEVFGKFDCIVTGITFDCLMGTIRLQSLLGEKVPVYLLDALNRPQVTGKRILLLGATGSIHTFRGPEFAEAVAALAKDNTIVGVFDFTPDNFWLCQLESLGVEGAIDHSKTVDADAFFEGCYDWADCLESRLMSLLNEKANEQKFKFSIPDVDWQAVELIWMSRTEIDPFFFEELVDHFSDVKRERNVDIALFRAKGQKTDAEDALNRAQDLGHGVWIVDLPFPETALTNVATVILTEKEGARAVIGVEVAGQGPFLTIQIFGKEREGFIAVLRESNIRLSFEKSAIPQSMWPVRVHSNHQERLVEILKAIP